MAIVNAITLNRMHVLSFKHWLIYLECDLLGHFVENFTLTNSYLHIEFVYMYICYL